MHSYLYFCFSSQLHEHNWRETKKGREEEINQTFKPSQQAGKRRAKGLAAKQNITKKKKKKKKKTKKRNSPSPPVVSLQPSAWGGERMSRVLMARRNTFAVFLVFLVFVWFCFNSTPPSTHSHQSLKSLPKHSQTPKQQPCHLQFFSQFFSTFTHTHTNLSLLLPFPLSSSLPACFSVFHPQTVPWKAIGLSTSDATSHASTALLNSSSSSSSTSTTDTPGATTHTTTCSAAR